MSVADLAKFCKMPGRTIYGWENGVTSPKTEFFTATQDLGFDISYIVTGKRTSGALSGPMPAPAGENDTVHIPLFSACGSMGSGSDLLGEDVRLREIPVSLSWIALNAPGSRPIALSMLRTHGDSMANTLNAGDFAIVDTDCQVADVDGVYVLQADGQLFIKRITRRMDGSHVISSDNPLVRTVDVLDGSQPVRICGRVVYGWNGRRI